MAEPRIGIDAKDSVLIISGLKIGPSIDTPIIVDNSMLVIDGTHVLTTRLTERIDRKKWAALQRLRKAP